MTNGRGPGQELGRHGMREGGVERRVVQDLLSQLVQIGSLCFLYFFERCEAAVHSGERPVSD